jgi:hypothetical protein
MLYQLLGYFDAPCIGFSGVVDKELAALFERHVIFTFPTYEENGSNQVEAHCLAAPTIFLSPLAVQPRK